MGGSALVIHGTPSADLLTPRAAARSFTDRLLGRQSAVGPKETPLGRDRVLLEIPSTPLRPMADDFRAFVDRAFDHPWPATTAVGEYLAIANVITTYVRGDRVGHGAPGWYVQLTFSGCAGMAETSAAVATHWAEIWYRQHADELASKYFLPFGFTPTGIAPNGPAPLFAPLGQLGYGLIEREEPEPDPDDPASRSFEIDRAVLETLGEEDLTREWRQLEAAVREIRAAGACLCQFCRPAQDRSRLERLAAAIRAAH